jgi:hypothetical protein
MYEISRKGETIGLLLKIIISVVIREYLLP